MNIRSFISACTEWLIKLLSIFRLILFACFVNGKWYVVMIAFVDGLQQLHYALKHHVSCPIMARWQWMTKAIGRCKQYPG